jgi:RNA polymerase sigma-70 factor (ECF subfamily)
VSTSSTLIPPAAAASAPAAKTGAKHSANHGHAPVVEVMAGANVPELTDIELVHKFRAGDDAAFETLVNRHRQLTFNFIYRMVGNQANADDLYQDTWLKVLRNAHTYQPRAKFTTWLLQIARNTVLDHYKRENLRQHVSLDLRVANDEKSLASMVPSEGPQPEEVLLSREVTDEVQKAICRLPVKQQEALVLRIYHHLAYSEIAQLMGAPEGTAKYWVHEAVAAVTKHLELRGIV